MMQSGELDLQVSRLRKLVESPISKGIRTALMVPSRLSPQIHNFHVFNVDEIFGRDKSSIGVFISDVLA